MPGKIFSRKHSKIFFLFFPENRLRHFKQGDNLHEISKATFLGTVRKISINLSSAEFAHKVVKVKKEMSKYFPFSGWGLL